MVEVSPNLIRTAELVHLIYGVLTLIIAYQAMDDADGVILFFTIANLLFIVAAPILYGVLKANL